MMYAKKSLGQNFLINPHTLEKILAAAQIKPNEHVIEIGPGHGVLTQKLLEAAHHVTAIELDDRLIPELEKKFGNLKNFTLLHQDALTFAPSKTPYKIVANIPYYITSPLINHFLREQTEAERPTHLTLLVQREVAEKICKRDGKTSVLSMQVDLFGTPKIMAKVPPTHFSPAPKVDSSILTIERTPCPLNDNELTDFFELLHRGFAHKRKKLIRNLESETHTLEQIQTAFHHMKLEENCRAETLTTPQWVELFRDLHDPSLPTQAHETTANEVRQQIR